MPNIADARNLNLSQLVNQLNLAAQGNKELRSSGTQLYVKESAAKVFVSEASRTNHRNAAIGMVRDGLAREYNVSAADANRIMANVFRAAPTQISSADANRLHNLGVVARGLAAAGMNEVRAFEVARHAETLQAQGMAAPAALAAARTAQTLIEAGSSEADALSIGRHKETLLARGLGDADALAGARRAHTLVSADHHTAAAAIEAVVVGREAVSGAITPLQASGSLAGPPVGAFADYLKHEAGGLARFPQANAGQQATWLTMANLVGAANFIPSADATRISTSAKASMLQALSASALAAAGIPGQRAGYEAMIQLNKAITVNEAYPDTEHALTHDFMTRAGQDRDLLNARANWDRMDTPQRTAAMQRMVDIHAQVFGYGPVAADYLDVKPMPPGNAGGLLNDASHLEVNTAAVTFDSFRETFDTVVHESTHRYQHHLVAELAGNRIPPGDSRHDQARLMAAMQATPIYENVTVYLGIGDAASRDTAYREQPTERHAYFVGGGAQFAIPNYFR